MEYFSIHVILSSQYQNVAGFIFRQFDVSSNNQLLECNESHSLYHQVSVERVYCLFLEKRA